ncbi:MAG: YifB family Mg chelatase-like AAA ATPase [Clostridia bacterium]|nr:YifB family Mg chelatase-like AAA ATPase [Clostridia bacterium]
MLSIVYSAGLIGIDGFLVSVECNSQEKLPKFEVIGLPGAAMKESKERIIAAMENVGYAFPESCITVNLAPADRKKEGSTFDLAMMIGIMQSNYILPETLDLSKYCFIGELSLTGKLREAKGVLCMTLAAKEAGLTEIFVPQANAKEASVVKGVNVYGVSDLSMLIRHLRREEYISPTRFDHDGFKPATDETHCDFSDVKGQDKVKRALEIAAAGGHNVLMIGPPGTGKSMLAKRLPTILPEISFDEAIETSKIHSVVGKLNEGLSIVTKRPFRSPHHTMSAPSLVGGGSNPQPGEISLAHNGVLFLDELPEFNKAVTESLRQPLEDGKVTITRTGGKVTYPCSFMLVAAMNPCKCGYFGHPTKKCHCKQEDIKKYMSKISGPLLDRIDIQVEVSSLTYDELSVPRKSETSAQVRERVDRARKIARERCEAAAKKDPMMPLIYKNSDMSTRHLAAFCKLDEEASALLRNAYDKMGLSARGYDRLLRVARTIADLAGSENIGMLHVAEAIQLRSLDRKYFN